jgi:hypothetical protein
MPEDPTTDETTGPRAKRRDCARGTKNNPTNRTVLTQNKGLQRTRFLERVLGTRKPGNQELGFVAFVAPDSASVK